MSKYIIGQMGENMKPRTIEVEVETPTPKTVEEVVAEFETKFGDENIWKDETGETAFVPIGNLSDWLRTTLTAQNQAADERLREVVLDIIKMADALELECGKDGDKGTKQWKAFKGFRNAIRDKHGITNL